MEANGLEPIPVAIVHVAGAPQISDGLLSQTMQIGSGGITAMMVSWDKTKAIKGQAMKGIVALSVLPYELLTTNPAIKSLADLGGKNKIGLPAIKVSIPAILLQMAAERRFGAGNYGKLDPLTVSLAQPDGATALLSGGGTVDSYIFAPPFNYQLREHAGIHRIWSSAQLTGGDITSLAAWTTSRFRDDNPKTYQAVVAALHEAIILIKSDHRRAAADLPRGGELEAAGRIRVGDPGRARPRLRHRAPPLARPRDIHRPHRPHQVEPDGLEGLFLPGDRRREGELKAPRRDETKARRRLA